MKRRESPIRRVNPGGETRWVARYTAPDGKRRSAGTFDLKREAQDAIDAAYERPARAAETVGEYAAIWLDRHPRSDRTNATNQHRVGRVLNLSVEGRALKDWPLSELKRRHAYELVDHMLRLQGRSPSGVVNIVRVLSAMAEDAITDELCDANPFRGVRVRATDPRAQKQRRPVRVFSWEDMHALAAAAGRWEPMIRVLSDCGLRLGELLPLRRSDLHADVLVVQRTAWEGRVFEGTKTDHGESGAGREVPVPPSLAELLAGMPRRIDTPLLFPTLTGRMWRQRNWYRSVFYPAQLRSGVDARPHELRHSFVTLLRAAGVDPADLADIAGHTVQTATERYAHALRGSHDRVRGEVG